MKINKLFSLTFLLCAVALSANYAPNASAQNPAQKADTEMGLVKGSVFEDKAPKKAKDDARAWRKAPYGTPAVIPHSLVGLTPIIRGSNQCLICHDNPAKIGKTKAGDATPMPKSHYTRDMKMAGTRQECTVCHAGQKEVEPLVTELN